MGRIQLFIILCIGGVSAYLEFRNIREWSFPFGNLLNDIPLFALSVLTLIYLLKTVRQYKQAKRLAYFFPTTVMGLLFVMLILGHRLNRLSSDHLPTLFTATNYDIGSDGGFTLDFKKDNHLKGEKIDRFSTTRYWGSYYRNNDTLILVISLDFQMGRRAILQDSVMRMVDDTISFSVFYQQ